MLVENQVILTYWHPRNKEHLESKGYKYTHTGDPVYVKLEDMKQGSKCKVKVKCDFCGKIFEKTYKDYFRQRKNHKVDCCCDCHAEKAKETNQVRYGGNSPMSSPEVIEKMSQAFKEHYGVDWNSQTKEFQDKVKETSLRKYGYDRPSKNPQIKDKIRQTCVDRYGGPCPQSDPKIKRKTVETLCKNGNVKSSKPEQDMVSLLEEIYGKDNCHPQYPLGSLAFDCMLEVDGLRIDVEFDGNYWHQDAHKDIKRDYFVTTHGFKVLRFKGDYNAPSKEQIINGVQYLVDTEHHHFIIDV